MDAGLAFILGCLFWPVVCPCVVALSMVPFPIILVHSQKRNGDKPDHKGDCPSQRKIDCPSAKSNKSKTSKPSECSCDESPKKQPETCTETANPEKKDGPADCLDSCNWNCQKFHDFIKKIATNIEEMREKCSKTFLVKDCDDDDEDKPTVCDDVPKKVKCKKKSSMPPAPPVSLHQRCSCK